MATRKFASMWLRQHKTLVPLRMHGEVVGDKVKMTQSLLRRWLRDPKIPKEVRQHIWIWYRYRTHRGYAN